MNIYLKPDEEIVSIVDKLIQSADEEINLIIPSGAQIWQSSINLKLLKREANYLNKEVVLVVADDLGAEIAEKAGFQVKREKDLEIELMSDDSEEIQSEEIQQDEIQENTQGEEPAESDSIPKEESEDNDSEANINYGINYGMSQQQDSDIIGKLVEELDSPEKVSKFKTFLSKSKKGGKINFASNRFKGGKKARVEDKRMTDIITPRKEEPILKKKRKSLLKRKKQVKPKISKQSENKEFFLGEDTQPRFNESDMDVLRPRQEKEKVKKNISFGWVKIVIGIFVIGLIGAGIWFYQVMPNTEISLKATEEKVTFDLSVIGSVNASEIDQEENKIPLQVIEISKTKSREFEATGEEQLNQKARGFITIYNEYSSAPQTLMATTRFESPDGKIFRIPESVTVPGAEIQEGKIIPSSLRVEVVADQPGAEYNIGPTKFTIPGFKGSPKYAGFYGESKSAMSGGSTEKVKVVTQEDIDQAEETLIQEIDQEAKENFQDQIPEDLKLIDGAQKQETKILSTIEAGAQTDKFLVEVEGKITALLYNQEDLEKIVSLNAASKVSENKIVLPDSQQIKWLEPEVDLEAGEVVFSLYAEEKVAHQLNIQQIKEELLGLSETQVRKYFAEQDTIAEARISFRPFWAKSVSDNKEKIKIVVENLPNKK